MRSFRGFARHGFTLIELMIACTMMAILVFGVSGHLRAGIDVWKRLEKSAETLQRRRTAIERFNRDITHAIVIDPREEAYGLEDGKLPSPVFSNSQAEWYTAQGPSPERPMGALLFVRYWCGSDGTQTGLWRQQFSIAAARTRVEPDPALLLPGCETLELRYAYLPTGESKELDWRQSWSGKVNQLPGLVEMRLKTAENEESLHVFSVPAGTLSDVQTGEAP